MNNLKTKTLHNMQNVCFIFCILVLKIMVKYMNEFLVLTYDISSIKKSKDHFFFYKNIEEKKIYKKLIITSLLETIFISNIFF